MSFKEDFTDDTSFTTGGNHAFHHPPFPQWYQNYYAPGQSSVDLPMTNFNNHLGVSPHLNFNNSSISDLNNTPAFDAFNHYAALRGTQLPHPYLGHVNNMLLPFGQLPQNDYYTTPAFGASHNSMVPRSSPFTHPQVVPSTEIWDVAPTTPVTTVRLETISPDVLRGRYTRPVESGFQPFGHTTSYDSSYRHFELDEHENELSVPPQPHAVRGRSPFSMTPAPNGEVSSTTEGCFAQCGKQSDEDLIGCRNGSCVVAFHPECVKLGAREGKYSTPLSTYIANENSIR